MEQKNVTDFILALQEAQAVRLGLPTAAIQIKELRITRNQDILATWVPSGQTEETSGLLPDALQPLLVTGSMVVTWPEDSESAGPEQNSFTVQIPALYVEVEEQP